MLKQNKTKNEKKQNWKKCYCTLNTVFISLCLHDSVCVFFLHLHCSRSKWNKANHSKWKTKKKNQQQHQIQFKTKNTSDISTGHWTNGVSRHRAICFFSPSLNLVEFCSCFINLDIWIQNWHIDSRRRCYRWMSLKLHHTDISKV